jgi:CRP/FNR family transcriptional regulator, dissimilatory nitrate respiration regulator
MSFSVALQRASDMPRTAAQLDAGAVLACSRRSARVQGGALLENEEKERQVSQILELHSRPHGEIEALLSRSRLFREVSEEICVRVARAARRLRAGRREVLMRPGEDCHGLFIVICGYVALSVNGSPGKEKVIEIVGPNESFGDDALLTGKPDATVARMLTEGLLVFVPRKAVLEAIDRHPSMSRALLRNVSRRTMDMTHYIEVSSTRSAMQRVAGYLLRQMRGSEREAHVITLPVPKLVVASLLGLAKESFSRVLRMLAGQGLIEVRGRTIRVPEPEGLAHACHQGASCELCWGCPRGGSWLD